MQRRDGLDVVVREVQLLERRHVALEVIHSRGNDGHVFGQVG